MWDASKCDLCGECLTKCLYVDYDKEKAVADIQALMEVKEADILGKCITCCACSEYCPTGADPFDLILRMLEKTHAFPVSQLVHALPSRSRLGFGARANSMVNWSGRTAFCRTGTQSNYISETPTSEHRASLHTVLG